MKPSRSPAPARAALAGTTASGPTTRCTARACTRLRTRTSTERGGGGGGDDAVARTGTKLRRIASRALRYEGDFVDDVKEGQGVLQYVDGERYEGEWRAGRMHGGGPCGNQRPSRTSTPSSNAASMASSLHAIEQMALNLLSTQVLVD